MIWLPVPWPVTDATAFLNPKHTGPAPLWMASTRPRCARARQAEAPTQVFHAGGHRHTNGSRSRFGSAVSRHGSDVMTELVGSRLVPEVDGRIGRHMDQMFAIAGFEIKVAAPLEGLIHYRVEPVSGAQGRYRSR